MDLIRNYGTTREGRCVTIQDEVEAKRRLKKAMFRKGWKS